MTPLSDGRWASRSRSANTRSSRVLASDHAAIVDYSVVTEAFDGVDAGMLDT
jgi:hypothetical protein